ncbi:hypothetical protein C8A05DRAFT_20632, partial [Staphylotrichum tortipilum]
LYIVFTVVVLLGVKYGIGKHLEDVPPLDRPTAMMFRWVGTYLYITISALTKVAIGLFLLRICSQERWQRITLWAVMGIVAVFNVYYVFAAIFNCSPAEYQWTSYSPVPPDGECNNANLVTIPTYIAALLNVLADLILPLLPAMLVWKTKMETRKKISVYAVLVLGASIASIVRIPYAYLMLDKPEYLYVFEPLAAWSTVEIGLGLTASSLATLMPLFRKIKIFTRAAHHSGASSAGFKYQGQGRTPNALPSSPFADKGSGAPKKGNEDVEALKLKRQRSDEIELYRFGS